VPQPVVQVAYAVDDLEAAGRAWAERTGAGPFFLRQHPPAAAVDASGRAAVFCHASSYGQWGALQLELVQVQAGTSASLRSALPSGRGVHHVAWFCDDLASEQRRLVALGWPMVMTAHTASGSGYAFHDARHDIGHLVEVYEPATRLLALYGRVADASRNWDGRAPVRPLGDLGDLGAPGPPR
jgi:hypothetical protein